MAPNCTLGPSLPRLRPENTETVLPNSLPRITFHQFGEILPRISAVTCGIPLLAESGTFFIIRATRIPIAASAQIHSADIKGLPFTASIIVYRYSSAFESRKRKRTQTSPAAIPVSIPLMISRNPSYFLFFSFLIVLFSFLFIFNYPENQTQTVLRRLARRSISILTHKAANAIINLYTRRISV